LRCPSIFLYLIFASLSRLAFRLPRHFYLAYFAFLTVHTQHVGVFAFYLSHILLLLVSFSELWDLILQRVQRLHIHVRAEQRTMEGRGMRGSFLYYFNFYWSSVSGWDSFFSFIAGFFYYWVTLLEGGKVAWCA
jgi:hypothetical protein